MTLFSRAVPSDYRLASGKQTTCPNPGVLAPGEKCHYGLTLTPAMAGLNRGPATILANARNPASMVSLVGRGK
jgi:hypothetical protein